MSEIKAPRFVVYHVGSTMEKKSFYHYKPANALADKLNAARNYSMKDCYAVARVEFYRDHVVHMVTRVNLQTGKEYQEPSNTPGYCSPASEAYWSM
jgi:hypothetical protein